jgi:hypothetical protein
MTSKPAPPKPAGPGPKPSGPSHPAPTGPPHGNGHALPSLPRLGEIIRDSEHHCQQLLNILGRDYDPASASTVEAWPGMLLADLELANLKSDVRQVLRGLADLAGLRHPPAGSAVRVDFEDRPGPDARVQTLTPSGAAGSPPARESTDDPQAVRAGASSDLRRPGGFSRPSTTGSAGVG